MKFDGKGFSYTNESNTPEYNQQLHTTLIGKLKENKGISNTAVRYYESLLQSKMNRGISSI